MKKESLYALIFIFLNYFCPELFSQSGVEPSRLKQFNITINFEDYTVKTQMLSQNKSICVSNDKVYMWYGSQKIIETTGGYGGKLIHGTYKAFYLNNQLKEQGQIKYGLRHREWKYWYPDGKLKEVIHWKNGVKSGRYCLYNDYGQLMAKSYFKKDKLHGKFYTYGPNGKVIEKKKYKRGDEVSPKPKKIKKKKEEKPLKPEAPATKKSEPRSSKEKEPFLKRIFKKRKSTAAPRPVKEKKKIVTT